MKREKLGLHRLVLPAVAILHHENEHCLLDIEGSETVFDCRRIDREFLADTGDAAFEEMENTKERVRLPFDACWFEFSDCGVWAIESNNSICNLEEAEKTGFEVFPDSQFLGTTVEFRLFEWERGWTHEDLAERIGDDHGVFSNGVEFPAWQDDEETKGPQFMYSVNATNESREDSCKRGARLLCGILALMSDKLLATEFLPDFQPSCQFHPRKIGEKLPNSSDVRVLTLNLGAVRRLARPASGTHESPRLHWRRGHSRVLHRGSEFEGKTWVKRCLVGDPNRGFIRKDYRTVWRPPMLAGDSQAPLNRP